MEQTGRLILGCALALALLTGFIGCAGHQTGTTVGHETEGPPSDEIALPDLVVEEHVKEEPVVPSAVPPGSEQPQQEAAAVVEPSEPAVAPMPEPAPETKPARKPAPPTVRESDLLPLPVEPGAVSVFLLDIPFNFDQYSLREDALAFVEVNATRLKEEGVGQVVLEGRGDEVGTADYNLVLGERRAREVQRYLRNLGLEPSNLRVVSYGKERPLCFEHTTECWQMNRSVRMVVE